MTLKDREDRFIEACRKDNASLTFEAEILLRYGFAHGAEELNRDAYADGVRAQKAEALAILGAAPQKIESEP